MSFRIEAGVGRNVVMLWVEGRFDLSTGFAVFQCCQPDMHPFRHNGLNLGGVSDLRDAGLSWLRMFMRWAQGAEIGVQIINVRPEHRQRCAEWGIPVATSIDQPSLRKWPQEQTLDLELGVWVPHEPQQRKDYRLIVR